MIFNGLDLSNLPKDREPAFVDFVTALNEELELSIQRDRTIYSDQNGNYEGSYEPERSFVTAILAFLDEYSIDSEITDISECSNQDFAESFGRFKSRIGYITTRFKLRKNRIKTGSIGTLIEIDSNYKSEIGSLLEKIRKIVNSEIESDNKKDKIFSKIASLQSEVDRSQTTVDALFGRALDLSQVIGKFGENVSPLIDQMERLKKLFWDSPKKVEQLPKPDRPKRITHEKDTDPRVTKGTDLDNINDEIPF